MNIKGKIANSPIKKTVFAYCFGIGVNLLNQVVLVPIYLIYWGNELYSDWIVLSAAMVIFSMSDAGLNTVIQNRFSIKLAAKDYKECDKLLTDNWLIVTSLFSIAIISISIYVSNVDIVNSLGLHCLGRRTASAIFIILAIKIFLAMYSGIASAIYRATHNASRGVYLDQTCTLVIFITTLICLMLGYSMFVISIAICVPNLLLVIYKHYDTRKYYAFKFSIKNIDLKLLKKLYLPSLSFMSFPFGNAIILQGYTMLVNKYFGADGVVLYNTTRTLTNFLKTFLGTIQNSVWPEYSIAYGQNNLVRMRDLHYKTIRLTMILAITISILLLVFGGLIYKVWTHNQVQFNEILMGAFLLILFLEMLWNSSGVTLMSTNNHTIMGLIFVVSAAISLGIGIVTCKYCGNLSYVPFTIGFMEVVMLLYTIPKGISITQDTFKNLCKQVIKVK